MSISIIGAGNVGMALGKALTQRDESVVFGVTDPTKYAIRVESLGSRASITTPTAAIAANDLIILAVPFGAVEAIAKTESDWDGKIIVDATNPIAPGLAGLTVGTDTSGAEKLAAMIEGARVVKAFNTTGAENLANASYQDGVPFMPVCGDDADARQQVMALAKSIGFDAIDLGPLSAARYLEPFAMTWIHLAIKQGYGRQFAFGLLRRD